MVALNSPDGWSIDVVSLSLCNAITDVDHLPGRELERMLPANRERQDPDVLRSRLLERQCGSVSLLLLLYLSVRTPAAANEAAEEHAVGADRRWTIGLWVLVYMELPVAW